MKPMGVGLEQLDFIPFYLRGFHEWNMWVAIEYNIPIIRNCHQPGFHNHEEPSDGTPVYEILDNAVDEAQAGFATQIDVVLHSDGSVSITDNGCGPIGASSEGKTDVMKKIRFHRWSRNLTGMSFICLLMLGQQVIQALNYNPGDSWRFEFLLET
ncbi:hypothetical protein GOBAR_AA09907 [Gossypium barbadense]|uniref:Histidine kinase/HSP90-like ATPase domain-containing protein n=1 Tax=Gossypium barbadense TaxID=3634 RepID=A0A2P5Y564_GOSBA|nr:hypothetical protein GOBAR_AA09907 [Gossypium barbadense]